MGNWQSGKMGELPSSLYELQADSLGKAAKISMEIYKGKVLLISNVATKCGLASNHFKQFKDLRNIYGDKGFEVLAFPSKQFKQERSDWKEIQKYVTDNELPYPFFDAVVINGDGTHPVFQYVKAKSNKFDAKNGKLSSIGWNFGKFLVDREGQVIDYYGPNTEPMKMEADIIKALDGAPTEKTLDGAPTEKTLDGAPTEKTLDATPTEKAAVCEG